MGSKLLGGGSLSLERGGGLQGLKDGEIPIQILINFGPKIFKSVFDGNGLTSCQIG